MKSVFHRFVDRIVQQTDGNQAERDDLYEELMIHLELSSADFIKEGFNKQQAGQKAMESFGDASGIGSQIQQAMFPFRKGMMLTLAMASISFSFGVYLAWLFLEDNAMVVWLIMSITISSLILVCAVRSMRYLNRRLWLNTIFIIHILIYSYGILLATGIENSISIILTLLSLFIVLLGIALLYLTTIKDYHSGKQALYKQAGHLHMLNITAGIILVCTTLFFIWGFLLFSGEWTSSMFKVFIPLLIWLIAYYLQMSLLAKNKKKLSYAMATIPILILAIVVGWTAVMFLWGP